VSIPYASGKDIADVNRLRLLWLEEDNIKHCPVQHFLSIAFADNAFATITNADELRDVKLDHADDVKYFPVKPEMLDKAFLINRDGTPFHYSSLWRYSKLLSYRCGHVPYVQLYDKRRYGSNILDGKLTVSLLGSP
jgi:hypothetical protein